MSTTTYLKVTQGHRYSRLWREYSIRKTGPTCQFTEWKINSKITRQPKRTSAKGTKLT